MPDPYRATCERCHDLEVSLRVVGEAKDELLKENGGLEEELRGYKRRVWASVGERLLQAAVFSALMGGVVILGFYVEGRVKQPDQCHSSVFLLPKGNSHTCDPGARVTTEPQKDEDVILVRCECTEASPPGGSATTPN
jgi:hypothetical protein